MLFIGKYIFHIEITVNIIKLPYISASAFYRGSKRQTHAHYVVLNSKRMIHAMKGAVPNEHVHNKENKT